MQWGRQRSKRARSFQDQKILHPDALFSSKKLTFLTIKRKQIKWSDMVTHFYFLFTLLPKQSNTQG